MEKNRLEAFSDGVLAIIITIMVLELSQPAGDGFKDLLALWPTLMAYGISFLFVASRTGWPTRAEVPMLCLAGCST